jgi:phosphoglucosamine mutase
MPKQDNGVFMKRRYFGTDGIRGQSNIFPMTPDLAMRVGIAVGTISETALTDTGW